MNLIGPLVTVFWNLNLDENVNCDIIEITNQIVGDLILNQSNSKLSNTFDINRIARVYLEINLSCDVHL